jgi:uncharacterized protein
VSASCKFLKKPLCKTKEERFFDLFTRHAEITLAGAEALRALLKGGDNVPQCCRVRTKRENEADEITREVLTALRRTFITPLDRGDIKDLITSMDDAIDQMNQTAKTIALFELRSFDAPMQEMGEIIVRAAKLNVDAAALDTRLQIFSTPARRIRMDKGAINTGA